MNRRLAAMFAVFASIFAGSAAIAQTNAPGLAPGISPLLLPATQPELPSLSLLSTPAANPLQSRPLANTRPHFSRARFAFLSATVYAAAFADMHQTVQERKYPWWGEGDPLARPLVRLPAPAY